MLIVLLCLVWGLKHVPTFWLILQVQVWHGGFESCMVARRNLSKPTGEL